MSQHLESSLFRLAVEDDLDSIWKIIQMAINKRRIEGSNQWQDGYPNIDVLSKDIHSKSGHVFVVDGTVVGYCALFTDEPAYHNLKGTWITALSEPYAVIHRLATDQSAGHRGIGTWILQRIEQYCVDRGIYSIKADTNHDNTAMLHVFKKLGYTLCGEVVLRENAHRLAFEKPLKQQ